MFPNNNVISENGVQFIPASQRPDGTWRKARRVKEGYVPQEEIPLYESKGKQSMNKKPEPIVLPSGQIAKRAIPGLYIVQNENEKKQTKKKNKKKNTDNQQTISNQLENMTITDVSTKQIDIKSNTISADVEQQEQKDPSKKLKNLKKRLREVEALEEKLKNGLIPKPEPEQLTKIKRKNDLLLQIHELEKEIEQ